MKTHLEEILSRYSKKQLIEFIISHPCNHVLGDNSNPNELIGKKVRFSNEWIKKSSSNHMTKEMAERVHTITGVKLSEYGGVMVFLDISPYSYAHIAAKWLVPANRN